MHQKRMAVNGEDISWLVPQHDNDAGKADADIATLIASSNPNLASNRVVRMKCLVCTNPNEKFDRGF